MPCTGSHAIHVGAIPAGKDAFSVRVGLDQNVMQSRSVSHCKARRPPQRSILVEENNLANYVATKIARAYAGLK